MSPREQAQKTIVDWLNAHKDKFNAPYGVLDGITELANGGKVRTITFGMARSLDCNVTIWSENRIDVRPYGPASWQLGGIYHSVAELLENLEKM